MKTTIKVWTGLGLATALVGTGLAGCAGEEGEGGEGMPDQAAPGSMSAGESGEGEGGEGEGGEGGEGEGGVSVADASSDPVAYGSALAIVEAHSIAARDAYAAGETRAAAEMFGHPVSEVLADMRPVFEERGIEDFSDRMNEASSAALEPDNREAVNARFAEIIDAVRKASAKAPGSNLSEGSIAAGIMADQIDRAVTLYRDAAGSDLYAPYLDGYGFAKAAEGLFERKGPAIEAQDAQLHASIADALELLDRAYPEAKRPETLDANVGALSAAASNVTLNLPSQ